MRRAAEEASAASRGRPRPRRIALLTDTLGNSYSDSIVDEVVEVAAGEGVEVVCLVDGLTEYPPRTTLATDNAAPSSVDGVLVLSLGNSVAVEDLVAYCERYRPLPICTMTIPWSAHPRVLIDNEPGMRDGVRHLIRAHGCRRIGFVRGPSVSGEAELRLRVYRDVLAEHDIAYDPALVSPPGSYIVQDGVNAVRTFLEHRKLTLDAIACVNDGAAIGVMQELSARGIVVPDQIAVLGFDDIEVSPYLDAPLTTVRQPIRAQAREACLFLLALIAGERRPTPVLRTELVVRESCGCSGYPQGAAQLAPTSSVPPTWAPIHELCEAFRADVTSGGDAYTKRLKSIVDDAARRGHDVGAYQKLVTAIQLPMTEGLEVDSPDWRRAGALLHESRVLVSDASERAPTMQQLRAEELCIRLNRSVRALLAAEDLASLKRAVAAHLPQFGIGGCFVCVYETDQTPVEWARLVLAWSSGKEISLPEGGLRFPRRELLPEAIALAYPPGAYVGYPLGGHGASTGYVLWRRGAEEGFVYEALELQFTAALDKLRLLERVVAEGRRREAAERERLESEVRIARRIRDEITPRDLRVPGLAIAAAVEPRPERGRDYYDVVSVDDVAWISLGSVSAQGPFAGLLMVMRQSAVMALALRDKDAAPADVLAWADRAFAEDAVRRGVPDERASVTLLRCHADGRLAFAGGHAGVLVRRASSGLVERLAAGGACAGDGPLPATEDRLAPGDLLVIYGHEAEPPGPDGARAVGDALAAALQTVGDEPVRAIGERLTATTSELRSGRGELAMLLVARHLGPAGAEGAR